MPTATRLMTVEEFREQVQDPPGERAELHHGEVVTVARPKYRHWKIQNDLAVALGMRLQARGRCGTEFSFRPLPEFELWTADIAFIAHERLELISLDDNLHGVPELVVEVLSPSNTVLEMNSREEMCLKNGAREFWVVDPDLRSIRVTKPDGRAVTYRQGGELPLDAFGGEPLPVSEIFP